MSPEVEQIEKVRSQLTDPQLTFDLDSPLHIHRTSLRQECRTHWHFTGDIIISTISIMVFLVLFRSYFVKLVQHCCPTNGTEPKAIKQSPSPHPPQPTQRAHESRTDNLQRNVTSLHVQCKINNETQHIRGLFKKYPDWNCSGCSRGGRCLKPVLTCFYMS